MRIVAKLAFVLQGTSPASARRGGPKTAGLPPDRVARTATTAVAQVDSVHHVVDAVLDVDALCVYVLREDQVEASPLERYGAQGLEPGGTDN